MANNVQVDVRSQLQKIIEELDRVQNKSKEVSKSFEDLGKKTGESIEDQTKKTETYFDSLTNFGRRAAEQMKSDFKSLLAINAVTDALKLSNQFRNSIKETIELGDTVRKLGNSFGIASSDFSKFQSNITKGLGNIGIGAETAAKTLEGLVGTGVKGEGAVLAYSKTAGQLASVSNSRGQEGEIAKGLANVLRARGTNVNDTGAMGQVAEDLRRVFLQTGKGPVETLNSMESLFSSMSKDMRSKTTTRGLANLAAASQVAGPNSTKFLEEMMGKSPIARMAFEAQGGKGVFNDKGIDLEKFGKFAKSIMGRIGGDPRLAAQTLGLSEDAAEGFIRLADSLDRVKAAQEGIEKSTGDLNSQYEKSKSLGEAFSGSVNRVKGMISGPTSGLQQSATDMLTKMSSSRTGALATVAGGAGLAALLGGFGMRGIGSALATGAAATAVTGQKPIPVFVVNMGMGGMGAGAAGAVGGLATKSPLLGLLGKAGLVAAAAGTGIAIGSDLNDKINTNKSIDSSTGMNLSAIGRVFNYWDKLLLSRFGVGVNAGIENARKLEVKIEAVDPKFKATVQRRGGSYGP